MNPSASFYPLRFHPVFRRYIWGGRRLGEVLGKPIGEGDNYAESWEIVDHGDDQSVVGHGPFAGRSLHSILSEHSRQVLGSTSLANSRFPLLLKLLDCNRSLSIQVHPNDAQAQRQDPPDLGKTEAWYILDSAPGATLYVGLRDDCSAADFRTAVSTGTIDRQMRRLYPKAGQAILIPAGTVHALGEGLLVAEIQQSSDTTFRLFDWNRVGSDGRPRPLHIDAGLAVVDWTSRPELISADTRSDLVTLASCDKFVLQRRLVRAPVEIELQDRFRILLVIEGTVHVTNDPAGPLNRGQSMLLPAALGSVEVSPIGSAAMLEMSIPLP